VDGDHLAPGLNAVSANSSSPRPKRWSATVRHSKRSSDAGLGRRETWMSETAVSPPSRRTRTNRRPPAPGGGRTRAIRRASGSKNTGLPRSGNITSATKQATASTAQRSVSQPTSAGGDPLIAHVTHVAAAVPATNTLTVVADSRTFSEREYPASLSSGSPARSAWARWNVGGAESTLRMRARSPSSVATSSAQPRGTAAPGPVRTLERAGVRRLSSASNRVWESHVRRSGGPSVIR